MHGGMARVNGFRPDLIIFMLSSPKRGLPRLAEWFVPSVIRTRVTANAEL